MFWLMLYCDNSILNDQFTESNIEFFSRHLKHGVARFSTRITQGGTAATDRHAAGGVALIGCARSIAHHQVNALKWYIEFFSHDLCKGSTNAGSQFDFAAISCNSPIIF